MILLAGQIPYPNVLLRMPSRNHEKSDGIAEFHLLGMVNFRQFLELQERLVYEVGHRNDGQIRVLLCEHPTTISVGRGGSRAHIRLRSRDLARRKIDMHWVSRGGGCVGHGPGQLAIYPLVPLTWHAWTVGDYMNRLHQALLQTVNALGFRGYGQAGRFGVGGRTGQLAACGVGVKHGVTCHGAFLNVNPPMDLVRLVDVDWPRFGQPGRSRSMGCLLAEYGRPVRMTKVRSVLIEQLAMALECQQYHLFTGHPLLASLRKSDGDSRDLAC